MGGSPAIVLLLTPEVARDIESERGTAHWKAMQGVVKQTRLKLKDGPEKVLTKADILEWLEGWGKEPSGADFLEFVCAVLDVGDKEWFEAIERGE